MLTDIKKKDNKGLMITKNKGLMVTKDKRQIGLIIKKDNRQQRLDDNNGQEREGKWRDDTKRPETTKA